MYITNHALQRAKERFNIKNKKELNKYINNIKKYFLNINHIIKTNDNVLIEYILRLEKHSFKDCKVRIYKTEIFIFDNDFEKLITLFKCYVNFENILFNLTIKNKKYKK